MQGEAIVRAAYGQPLGQQLGFCQSLDDTDCGAYAVAEVDGESVIPTDTVILSSGCLPADAEQGNCLPGAYALKYKAYDALGRVRRRRESLVMGVACGSPGKHVPLLYLRQHKLMPLPCAGNSRNLTPPAEF